MVICSFQDTIVLLPPSSDRDMSYLNTVCVGRLADVEKNIYFNE
jgi:hypothetical protein